MDHINENKQDNRVENLQWLSHRDNNIKSKARKIEQYDLNGIYIRSWNSIKEAGNFYKTSHIQEVCSGKKHTAKNYIWKYEYKIRWNKLQKFNRYGS